MSGLLHGGLYELRIAFAYAKGYTYFSRKAMKFDGFDWDSGNRTKCQKHGVSITEIESLFSGTPLVAPDALHSSTEQRFRAVGQTIKKRFLFIVFTLRKDGGTLLIRPISARYM